MTCRTFRNEMMHYESDSKTRRDLGGDIPKRRRINIRQKLPILRVRALAT